MKKTLAEIIEKTKVRRGYSCILRCKICGIKFKSSQSRVNKGLGKYCSKKCYGIASKGGKRPEIGLKIRQTKKERGSYVHFVCEICGKKIDLSISHAKGRRTCSRKCSGVLVSRRLKQMWENPPEGMIEKMRKAMIKRRSFGRIDKETKPEKIFREELEKRRIVFEQQFKFGEIMIADFFIPSLQAFIFVDGAYWHNLPSSIEKDWQQVEYIRTKGMKAYRFTEESIYENVGKCIDEVYEDSDQKFTMADLIDRFTILGIKTQMAIGEKQFQATRDYRRMQRVVLSGLEYFSYNNPETIIEVMKELLEVNIEIFMLVDKVQKNEHSRIDAKNLQNLNTCRSKLVNSLNDEFKEGRVIKV